MHRFAVSSPSLRLNRKSVSARGQELESLVETQGLRDRFFAWRGVSGRRYVCSVFRRGEEAFVADVTQGVVIGVAREGREGNLARPVCVLQAREGGLDRALAAMASEFGVAEWHVHFGDDAGIARDLAGSLLS
jgi:hypothetical protein